MRALNLNNPVLRMAICLKYRADSITHPWRRQSRKVLTGLMDLHQGKRCFIIGNGPSLKQTDLKKLRDEFTFGMNRIYLMFPELGFHTTYYVAINHLVVRQCAEDILKLPMIKFLPWSSRRDIREPTPDTVFLDHICGHNKHNFTPDLRKPFWSGATVTYVALQLAFHMGFEQVILVGVDHSYYHTGTPGKAVISQGDDPNHFSPSYFGRGFEWELPDLPTSEQAYRLARQAYEKAGRQILDATIAGKLTTFEKVDYGSIFM